MREGGERALGGGGHLHTHKLSIGLLFCIMRNVFNSVFRCVEFLILTEISSLLNFIFFVICLEKIYITLIQGIERLRI